MKKRVLSFTVFVIFSIGVIPKVYAGTCDSTMKPLTNCTQDQNVYGYFSDPSLATIEKNNCSAFSKKINKYCTQYCSENAETKFPTVINPMSVDKYQPILGGNHFKWDGATLKVTKNCSIKIDYQRWYNDYIVAMESYKQATERFFAEWHQIGKDVACGQPGYPKKKDEDCSCDSKDKTCGQPGYPKKKDEDCSCDSKDKTVKYVPYSQASGHTNPNPDCVEGAISCGTSGMPEKGCGTSSKECILDEYYAGEIIRSFNNNGASSGAPTYTGVTCREGYGLSYTGVFDERDRAKARCGRWKITTGKTGTSRYTEMTIYDWNGGVRRQGKFYCDVDGTPYFDGKNGNYQIDKFNNKVIYNAGTDHWKKEMLNQQNRVNELVSQLRACNKGSSLDNISTPVVKVTYTDPTYQYTGKTGRTVTYNGSKKTTGLKTTYTKPNVESYLNNMETIKCKIPSSPNEIKNMNSIYEYCTKTSFEYKTLFNQSVNTSITNTYTYKMPDNIFEYILKETGEAVDSNSPKVTSEIKNNYRYIDIGYPNYPVHYTTPTGEYPIYLTYSGLGTNGYWTNKMANKTGRYDCTYKVINRIIPCPEGECPIPDTCTPEHPENCPNGNGGNSNLNGINIIYRPISLVDPFPDYSGKGRKAGENWSNNDIKDYIINNRKVKSNQVYNKEPLYSFTLDAKGIRAIKSYNSEKDSQTHKKREYNDFNLTCSSSKNGKRCMSKFLKNIKNMLGNENASGKCLGVSSANFYSCADKPNQDKIKCGLNKNNKLECVNCSLAGNMQKEVCKGSGQ